MIDTGLKGKTVLVTGANNPLGIGAGIARAFAEESARVFLHYLRLEEKKSDPGRDSASDPGEGLYHHQKGLDAEQVLSDIKSLGAEAAAWEGDLSDPEVISALFEKVEQTFGIVDILVNNAAAWQADSFIPTDQPTVNKTVEMWTDHPVQITAASFEMNFLVNTKAAVLLMTEFGNHLVQAGQDWGRIINISSGGAYCFPSEASYGASKLALEGYTRSAAVELGQFGITVNSISPGPIQTGWITKEMEEGIIKETPLGRVGTPQDVADVAVFLASTQARWITGQVVQVGGGHTI